MGEPSCKITCLICAPTHSCLSFENWWNKSKKRVTMMLMRQMQISKQTISVFAVYIQQVFSQCSSYHSVDYEWTSTYFRLLLNSFDFSLSTYFKGCYLFISITCCSVCWNLWTGIWSHAKSCIRSWVHCTVLYGTVYNCLSSAYHKKHSI